MFTLQEILISHASDVTFIHIAQTTVNIHLRLSILIFIWEGESNLYRGNTEGQNSH